MQPKDSSRHAIIGWLSERGHSPEAIQRIMERLGQYNYHDVYRALFEGDQTFGVDLDAIVSEVEDEFLAEARQEICEYLADRGHSPNEVEQMMQRLEQYDVRVVHQMLSEAATDSTLIQVLDEVRGDWLLAGFVGRCGDVRAARSWIKSVQDLVEYFGSFQALNLAVDAVEGNPRKDEAEDARGPGPVA
jgi:hypothetical protein